LVPGEEAVFMSATRVTAVIPHWNRRDLLETLFTSLTAQTKPFDQIIVADNGSADGSIELALDYGAQVLRLGRNLGFAAAINRGITACDTPWVAVLNNDVTLSPDWLQILTNVAEQENASFASGKLLRTADPSTLDGAFDEISRGACACRCGAGKTDAPMWNQPRTIRFAPMTAALFRRDLFRAIGPLDESFGSYLEDIDFGLRCALAGRSGVYVPTAVGYHRGSSTLGTWNSDTVWRIARNQVLLTAKYFHGEPRWPILVGQLLWGLVALRHGSGWAYLRGKIAGLWVTRNLPIDHRWNSPQAERLRDILEASEKEILELERQSGFSWYWRTYFWFLLR
jgi:GT2 family glycosyltransferase